MIPLVVGVLFFVIEGYSSIHHKRAHTQATCSATCPLSNTAHHLNSASKICDPVPGRPMCAALQECSTWQPFSAAEILVLRLEFSDLRFSEDEKFFNYNNLFLSESNWLGTFLRDNSHGQINLGIDNIKPRFDPGSVAQELLSATYSHADIVNCATNSDGTIDRDAYFTLIANSATFHYKDFAAQSPLWAIFIPWNAETGGWLGNQGKGVVHVGFGSAWRDITRTWGRTFGLSSATLLRPKPDGCSYSDPNCPRWAQIENGDTTSAMSVDPFITSTPDLLTHWPLHEKANVFLPNTAWDSVSPAGGDVSKTIYAHNEGGNTSRLYGVKITDAGEYSYWLSYQHTHDTASTGVSIYLTSPSSALFIPASTTEDVCRVKWCPIHGGVCKTDGCAFDGEDTVPSCLVLTRRSTTKKSYCQRCDDAPQIDMCPDDNVADPYPVLAQCVFPWYDTAEGKWYNTAKFDTNKWTCPSSFDASTNEYSDFITVKFCQPRCTASGNMCVFPFKNEAADATYEYKCIKNGDGIFHCPTEVDGNGVGTTFSHCVPCPATDENIPADKYCADNGLPCKLPFEYNGEWYDNVHDMVITPAKIGITSTASRACPTELYANYTFDPAVHSWGSISTSTDNAFNSGNTACKIGESFQPHLSPFDDSCYEGTSDCAGCDVSSGILTSAKPFKNDYFTAAITSESTDGSAHLITVDISFPDNRTQCALPGLSGSTCSDVCPGGQWPCGGTSRGTGCTDGTCSTCLEGFSGSACLTASLCDISQVSKPAINGEKLWSYSNNEGFAVHATEVVLTGRIASIQSITVWGRFDHATAVSPPTSINITVYPTDSNGAIQADAQRNAIASIDNIAVASPNPYGDIALTATVAGWAQGTDEMRPGTYWVSTVVDTVEGVRWYHSQADPTDLANSYPENLPDKKWDAGAGTWVNAAGDARTLITFGRCDEYFEFFENMKLLIFGIQFADLPMGNANDFDWSILYTNGPGGRVSDWLSASSDGTATIGQVTIAPNPITSPRPLLTGTNKLFTTTGAAGPSKTDFLELIKAEVLDTVRQVDGGAYDPDTFDLYIAYLPDLSGTSLTTVTNDPTPVAFVKDWWISDPRMTSPAAHTYSLMQLTQVKEAVYLQPETIPSPPAFRKNLVINGGAESGLGSDIYPWQMSPVWTTGPLGSTDVSPPTNGGQKYFVAPTVSPNEQQAALWQKIPLTQYAVGTKFAFSCLVRSGSLGSFANVALFTNVADVWDSGDVEFVSNNAKDGIWKELSWVFWKTNAMETEFTIKLTAHRSDSNQNTAVYFDNVMFTNHPDAINSNSQVRVSAVAQQTDEDCGSDAINWNDVKSAITTQFTTLNPINIHFVNMEGDCQTEFRTWFDIVVNFISTTSSAETIGQNFQSNIPLRTTLAGWGIALTKYEVEEHGTVADVKEVRSGSNDFIRIPGGASSDVTGMGWVIYDSITEPVGTQSWMPHLNVISRRDLGWLASAAIASINTDVQDQKLWAHNGGFDETRAIKLGKTAPFIWLQWTHDGTGYGELGKGLQILFDDDGKPVYLDGTPSTSTNCLTYEQAKAWWDSDDALMDHAEQTERRTQPNARRFCQMVDTVVAVGSSIDVGYATIFVRSITDETSANGAYLTLQIVFNEDTTCAVFGVHGTTCAEQCPGGAANPCNGRGVCGANGECECDDGWSGEACTIDDECEGSKVPGEGCGCDIDRNGNAAIAYKKVQSIVFGPTLDSNDNPAPGNTIWFPVEVQNPSHLSAITFHLVNVGGCFCDECGCTPQVPDQLILSRFNYNWGGCEPFKKIGEGGFSETFTADHMEMWTNPLMGNFATIKLTIPEESQHGLKALRKRDDDSHNYYYYQLKPVWNNPNGRYHIVTEDGPPISINSGVGQCVGTLLPDYFHNLVNQEVVLEAAKFEGSNQRYRISIQHRLCNPIYKGTGIIVPDSLLTAEFLDFETGITYNNNAYQGRKTARAAEKFTITFSGFTAFSQSIYAKIANNKIGFGCGGEAPGGEEKLVDTSAYTVSFKLANIGSYSVCVRTRNDWLELSSLLEILPPTTDTTEDFYGYSNCEGLVSSRNEVLRNQIGQGTVCGCVWEQKANAVSRDEIKPRVVPDWLSFGYFPRAGNLRFLQGCCGVLYDPTVAPQNTYAGTVAGMGALWDVCVAPDQDVPGAGPPP